MSRASGNWYDGLGKAQRRALNKRMMTETPEARPIIAWALLLTDVFSYEEGSEYYSVDKIPLDRLAAVLAPYRSLIAGTLGQEKEG